MQLPPHAAREVHENNQLSLLSWELLAREAALRGKARYQVKPKHHAMVELCIELLRTCKNPRSQWTFKHEYVIGYST
eukprot:2198172-Alexandrium_andersonii.AAC.1